MTYEEYLDEVTTLIVETYNLSDAAAIKLVVKAQDAEFFVQHDDVPAMRTLERAHADAKTLFATWKPATAKPARAKPAGAKPAPKRPAQAAPGAPKRLSKNTAGKK